MAPSWFQILIVVVLLVLLFGRGKISELMGDVAKGIKSFKKGISEDEEKQDTAHKSIEHDGPADAETKRHTREEANTSS